MRPSVTSHSPVTWMARFVVRNPWARADEAADAGRVGGYRKEEAVCQEHRGDLRYLNDDHDGTAELVGLALHCRHGSRNPRGGVPRGEDAFGRGQVAEAKELQVSRNGR